MTAQTARTIAVLTLLSLAACTDETSQQPSGGGGGAGGNDDHGASSSTTGTSSTADGGSASGPAVCVPEVFGRDDWASCLSLGCNVLSTRSDLQGEWGVCSNECDTDARCNGGSRCRSGEFSMLCRFPCTAEGACDDERLTCINGFCDLP